MKQQQQQCLCNNDHPLLCPLVQKIKKTDDIEAVAVILKKSFGGWFGGRVFQLELVTQGFLSVQVMSGVIKRTSSANSLLIKPVLTQATYMYASIFHKDFHEGPV